MLLASIWLARAAGADTPLRFDHLTVRDGLSHSWVQAVLKDSRGFMWFGTWDGLDRFDGSAFRVYRNEPDDPHSLGFSSVATLFEDSHGRLWVGSTWGGPGLSLYDRQGDRFRAFPRHTGPARFRVTAIAEDRDGLLWVATDAGLDLFDPERGTFVHYAHDAARGSSLPSDAVNSVRLDGQGRVWVGTTRGLARVDRRTATVVSEPLRAGSGSESPAVMDLLVDAQGVLWVATDSDGLYRFEPRTGSAKRYLPPRHDARVPPQVNLRRLLDDAQGLIYVGTENEGLQVFDPKSETWRSHLEDPLDDSTLSSSSIWALHRDDQGGLWIGTFNGGVDLLSPLGQRFHPIRARRDGLTSGHTSAILEDRRGDIWIGTDGGGLNRLDRRSGAFTHLGAKELGSAAVQALHQDRSGALWVGTWSGGLVRIALDGRLTRFRRDPRDPTTIALDSIWDIVETPEGELLLAGQQGVDLFDPHTGKACRLSSRYPGAGDGIFFAAAVDGRGNFWLGRSGGVRWVERASGRFTDFPKGPDDPGGMGVFAVVDLAVDARGNVWAASEGGGLVCFERGTAAQRRYDMRSGLPSNSVASLLVDDDGALWLGTSRGLCRFSDAAALPVRPRLLVFDARDGLQGSEYSRQARWRCRSGELFFGGQGGADFFFPGRITPNPIPPPIVLTGLRVFTRPVAVGAPGSPLTASLPELRELTIPYDQSVLTFEFAALNYLVPSKNRYQYRLRGFHDEWSIPDTEHSATYTNLSPGDYVLQVRGSNNDGVWNESGTSLRIRVMPPFWMSAWFRGLAGLGLLGVLVLAYRRRVAALEARRAATQAYYQAVLDERTRLARELHDTLEQAMAALKLQLGVVARTLRNGPEQAGETLALARRMLTHTIEEARRSIMDLRARALDDADLPEALRRQAAETTSGTQVQVQVRVEGTVRRLDAAQEHHLLRIAQEAITNALKHSGGDRVEVELCYEQDAVRLAVRDNGRGLAAATAGTSHHFGLQGMQERADRLGGRLELNGDAGAGLTVSVRVRDADQPGRGA